MVRIGKKTKDRYKRQVQSLINGLSRKVVVYLFSKKLECPNCYFDKYTKRYILCLVTWDPQNRYGNTINYTPAGSEGSTLVRLKTDPKYFDTFKNCNRLVIDDIECKIARPPLLRGLGNQSVLIIMAFTTEKPKVDTDEIIKAY
jgi:hypothetical protein